MDNPLFGNASSERIQHVMRNDWQRFSAIASVRMSIPTQWESAVREFDTLSQVFYRDHGAEAAAELMPIMEMLFDEALRSDPQSLVSRLEFMSDVLGSDVVVMDVVRRRADKHAAWTALPPAERQRVVNTNWMAEYRAGKLDAKPQAVIPRRKR